MPNNSEESTTFALVFMDLAAIAGAMNGSLLGDERLPTTHKETGHSPVWQCERFETPRVFTVRTAGM
jgi:hypothetical protein